MASESIVHEAEGQMGYRLKSPFGLKEYLLNNLNWYTLYMLYFWLTVKSRKSHLTQNYVAWN